MHSTIEQIVQHILKTWSPEDLLFVKRMRIDPMGMVGCQIRNDFGLWNDSPLTENWRTNEAGRSIKDGIDYSPDHPDAVSSRIIGELKMRIDEDHQQQRLELRKKVDAEFQGAYW